MLWSAVSVVADTGTYGCLAFLEQVDVTLLNVGAQTLIYYRRCPSLLKHSASPLSMCLLLRICPAVVPPPVFMPIVLRLR